MAPVVGENALFFMLISLDECCGASSAAASGLIESREQRVDGVMALTPGVPSVAPPTDGVWGINPIEISAFHGRNTDAQRR